MTLSFVASLTLGCLFGCACAQNESMPVFWATSIITETVWTVCGVEETTTILEQGSFSTSLVLSDACTLTGITVQPASSPTSCYSLPIPTTALEQIIFSTALTSSSPGSSDAADPVFIYLGDNATAPEYVGTLIDGNRYLLDISSNSSAAGQMALTLAGLGESLVFDQTGIHHYAAGCNTSSSVTIAGFLQQLTSIAQATNNSSPVQPGIRIKKREMPETNFTVVVYVEGSIGSQFQEPQVSFGPSACAPLAIMDSDEDWITLSWVCQHPGVKSDEKLCEASFDSWLRQPEGDASTSSDGSPVTSTIGSSPGNISNTELYSYLLGFLDKAGTSLTNLFPSLSPAFVEGLSWASTAQSAVVDAAEFGGEALCRALHLNDEYDLVLLDSGLSTIRKIGAYVSPPVLTIEETIASRTSRVTREPPRLVDPTVTAFASVTRTSFLPGIVHSFTSFIGGLPSALSVSLDVDMAGEAKNDMVGKAVETVEETATETVMETAGGIVTGTVMETIFL